MRRRSAEGIRLGVRGESMIAAVVLMLVFFVLGLSVLTGASAASSSVNARAEYRQAYYYARSSLDLLDESLRNGALGEYLRQHGFEQLQTQD
ncbi:MAG: hypothetical protein Q4C13_08325, partial [Clostridia bacterium]|nr:hypothetical protein [Clostridia bacterium]